MDMAQELMKDSSKCATEVDLVEGLRLRKSRLEAQLATINAAIEALDKNPEVANILKLVSQASRGY